MEKKPLMIAIHWYGPYNGIDQAHEAARDFTKGLYLSIGKCKYQRKASLQYIGISTSLHTRIKEDRPKLCEINREHQLWLGEVVTSEPSGKRIKVTPATLDYAEWLHARFLRLPLNEKKTKSLPPQSVTVLNRWLKPDYQTFRKHWAHPDWPDLIDYPGGEFPARVVWFGKSQRIFAAPDYASP